MKNRGYFLSIVAVVVGATLAGGLIGPAVFGSTVEEDLHQRLKEYTEVLEAAAYWSPEAVGSDEFVYSSIDGMVRTLDPHSSFLDPRDYSEMQDRQKGSFYGLGILVTKRNGKVTVITPLEGTPASRLGIRAGDIISEVEGEATDELPLDDVVGKLKGPKGTPVNIKIIRVGIEEPIPLTIVREAIPTNSVSYVLMINPEVGYVRLKDFTRTTVREFDQAINELQRKGMKKLIIDLRANPGGLLDAAVGIADHFVDKGDMIVYTKGRTPDSFQEFRAPGKQRQLNIPVVVLINRGSASASEIVAGAIQDHDRGLVVGETSWGKGLVQSVYTLQYGAGLALTTSKYYTPSGRNIQRDYTSSYDYYALTDLGEGNEENLDAVPSGEAFQTELGRKVFGGGGINPDYTVKPRDLSAVAQLLEMRNAFFNFAVEYAAKHPDVTQELEVGSAILNEFGRWVTEKKIVGVDELARAMGDSQEKNYLQRALKAEIVAAKFGLDASYPFRLRGDDQVMRAIELFPEAEKLAEEVARKKAESLAAAEPAATDDRAANSRRN